MNKMNYRLENVFWSSLLLQAERECQYDLPQAHLSPPIPDPPLIEKVFSPHPFTPTIKADVKGSHLYTDLRLTNLSETKRGQPSWTIEDYKRNSGDKGKQQLTALDLKVKRKSTAGVVNTVNTIMVCYFILSKWQL